MQLKNVQAQRFETIFSQQNSLSIYCVYTEGDLKTCIHATSDNTSSNLDTIFLQFENSLLWNTINLGALPNNTFCCEVRPGREPMQFANIPKIQESYMVILRTHCTNTRFQCEAHHSEYGLRKNRLLTIHLHKNLHARIINKCIQGLGGFSKRHRPGSSRPCA